MAILYVGTTATNTTAVSPDPASLDYGYMDISAPDAGRTLAPGNPMLKMRTSRKRKLNISWTLVTFAQASAILQAFAPEYFYVRYFDIEDGMWEVRKFYSGDKSMPVKWMNLPNREDRVTNLSFDVIEV